jgi:hypothetical protein
MEMHSHAGGRLRRNRACESTGEREHADASACRLLSDRDEDPATHPPVASDVVEPPVLMERSDELEHLVKRVTGFACVACLIEATPKRGASFPIGAVWPASPSLNPIRLGGEQLPIGLPLRTRRDLAQT